MAKGYSKDLRVRAVELVESGESAREAARILNLGASTTIRWMDRWRKTGNVEAKPGTGHSRSPFEQHKQWLIELLAAEPDLTLEEIRVRLRSEGKQKAGIGSIWRFFDRHNITFKKTLHVAEQDRPNVAAERAALKAEQPKLRAPRLIFIDETAVSWL
jgi:transposase